jgi:hypothetical protein
MLFHKLNLAQMYNHVGWELNYELLKSDIFEF